MLDFLDKPSVLIVLVLLLVVFGAKRLPGSARALGQSMRILKAEAKGLKDDEPTATPVTPPAAAAPLPETRSLPAAQPVPDATVEQPQPHQT